MIWTLGHLHTDHATRMSNR